MWEGVGRSRGVGVGMGGGGGGITEPDESSKECEPPLPSIWPCPNSRGRGYARRVPLHPTHPTISSAQDLQYR